MVNDRWGKDCRHKHGGYWTTEYAAGLKDDSHPWEESRGMALFLRLQSGRADRRLQVGPRIHPHALRPGEPRRQPALGHRPRRRRHHSASSWSSGCWRSATGCKVNGEAIYGTRFAGRSLPVERRQAARPAIRRIHGEIQSHGTGRPEADKAHGASSRPSLPRSPAPCMPSPPVGPARHSSCATFAFPPTPRSRCSASQARSRRNSTDDANDCAPRPGPRRNPVPSRLRFQDHRR